MQSSLANEKSGTSTSTRRSVRRWRGRAWAYGTIAVLILTAIMTVRNAVLRKRVVYKQQLYHHSDASTKQSQQSPLLRSWSTSENSTKYLQEWLTFRAHHPIDGEDRLSFADMAFLTTTYANMVTDMPRINEHDLGYIEKQLYPWIFDLDVIRARHIDRWQATVARTQERLQMYGWTNAWHTVQSQVKLRLRSLYSNAMTTNLRKQDGHQQDRENQRRGIVITAGNPQFRYTSQLIATIRNGLKSMMPIEVYYYGAEDLSADKQEFLTTHYANVRTVDLSSVGHFNESFVGLKDGTWAMKPYAVLTSNFTEVMLLDADSILLADPDDFFIEPGYTETGTLFFHDRLMRTLKYPTLHFFLREQLGDREASVHMRDTVFWQEGLRHRQESGLVLLNKSNPNVFSSLLFTLWQNAKSVRKTVTYNIFYGDKETFWLPFELAGLPYHFSRYWAGAIGPEHSVHSQGFCSDHILHFFEAPYAHAPADEEQTLYKQAWKRGRPAWMNGSLRNNKLYDPSQGVFDYTKAIWTMDGTWEWHAVPDDPEGGATCCMVDYTRWSMDDLNLGKTLPAIFEAGKQALVDGNQFYKDEEHDEALIDEEEYEEAVYDEIV